MKIAHISDIHIRLKDRQKEYKEVFARLYEKLKELNPDRILLAGDIVHSKITLSPEQIVLVRDLLTKLLDIAPVDMIVGNHDMNMSNTDRMDALTPVVDPLVDYGHGLNYMLETGLYRISDELTYGVYSLMDGKDLWLKEEDKVDGMSYVALYHGVIAGCKLDNDYVFSDSSMALSTFDNFDFTMLGDIHRKQFLDGEHRVAYCGSLIQQNHGEDIKKGFLMWDIKSRDDYTCKFIPVPNDYAYATIYAEDGILPDIELPPKTRIRVVWSMRTQDISRAEASRLNSLIIEKYSPISIQLTFKPTDLNSVGDVVVEDSSNLADPDVQQDLLRQWFENSEHDIDVDIDELMKIDTEVTESVSTCTFEDFSKSNWELKSISMENFMSYAEEVKVDFEKMNGVIGLFGNNAVGKSVIIDAILYALFNKTTREVKNEDLVNKNTGSDMCKVKLELEIRGVKYKIDRWTTRQYQKRSDIFLNARTDVTFKRKYLGDTEWEDLTGTERNATEPIIRNALGSFDDFMITTLSKQDGSSEFLKLRKSPRADLMLKFLGLEIFNKKYDFAKKLLKDVEHHRKSFNKDKEVDLLDTKKTQLKTLVVESKKKNKLIGSVEDKIDVIRSDISNNTSMINTTVKIDKDIKTLTLEETTLVDEIKVTKENKLKLEETMKDIVGKVEKLEKTFVLNEKIMISLAEKRDVGNKHKEKIKTNTREIESNKKVLNVYRVDLRRENTCPVMDDKRHESCEYLRGYLTKKDDCTKIIKEVKSLQKENETLQEHIDSMDHVYDTLDEQENIRGYVEKAVIKINKYKTEILELDNRIEICEVSLSLVRNQLKIAEGNEDTIINNKKYRSEIENLNVLLDDEISIKNGHIASRDEMSTKIVILKKEISEIEAKIEAIRSSDEKFNLYNTYCKAIHRNGLPVDVLKTYIPKINYEINKILSDVVEFGVYLKIDEDDTDIEIVMRNDGDGDDTRPASMSSGMEKLLINMSIRYALLSISNLNISDSWFVDEGFGVLDTENLFKMSRFFDNIKGIFKNVVIITHIDTLKDVADWVINIEKEDGISKVSVPLKNM